MRRKDNKNQLKFVNVADRVMKIKRQQSRYERSINAIWELFSDYSEISTIHGVRYLGEKKRHWSERVWWFLSIVISIGLSAKFISQASSKWINSPVIVSFSEESTPVFKIPFPSVTICTDIKLKQTSINYTDIWHKLSGMDYLQANITDDTVKLVHSLSPLCERPPSHIEDFIRLKNLTFDSNEMDENFFKNLRANAPTLNDLFFKCTWHHRNVSCSDIFKEIITDEGLCFTFNYLNASEIYNHDIPAERLLVPVHNKSSKNWNLINRNQPISGIKEDDIYPYRVLSGSEGLRVDLRIFEKDIDYLCGGQVQSFKILLHAAGEVPQMKKYYYRIPLDYDIVMAVRPNIMNSTESLIKDYKPDQRKCIAENERNLHSFIKYTQRNCQLNELTFRTEYKCRCVTFGMPRRSGTRMCRTRSDMECVQNVEDERIRNVLEKKALDFNCLPGCESISYDAEVSMARLHRYEYQRAAKQSISTLGRRKRHARIFISFKDEQFFASRRSEIYDITDFIAECGGILGLFMGISILSVIEMLYFSTLRLGCSILKRNRIKKRRLRQLKELNELVNSGSGAHSGEEPKPLENNNGTNRLPELKY